MTGSSRPPSGTVRSATRLRWLYHWNVSISVLLMLAVFGMLNYLAFRHYKRWDWTKEKLYTLSSRTEQVLHGLDSPVSIYVFLSESEPSFSEIKALLDRYREASSKIAVHLVDPDRRPAEFDMLAKRFNVMAGQVLGTGEMRADAAAVLATDTQRWIIKRDDLIGFVDMDGDNEHEEDRVEVRAERALTSAILQVTEGSSTKVCVAEGHGEWTLEPREQRTVYGLSEELKRDNVEMTPVVIRGSAAIPSDCHALFVIGPSRPYGQQEAEAVRAYLAQGGNVLLALDPIIQHDELLASGLETVAEQAGMKIERDIVVERDKALLPQQSVLERFFVVDYGSHVTTRVLTSAHIPTVLQQARVVRPVQGSGAEPLLRTSGQAATLNNVADIQRLATSQTLPSAQHQEVLSVAAVGMLSAVKDGASSKGVPSIGHRLIVIGDSDWLSATYLDAPELANLYLASAWTGWLTERPSLISIPPKQVRRGGVHWSLQDLDVLWWRLVVLLPLSMLILGLLVWWRRRA